MENVFHDNTITFFVITFNPPLMSGGTKGHTYLNKPGINGLIYAENSFSRSLFTINCL